VQLSAEAEDESSAEEELEVGVGVTGEPLTIGFNAGYLLDGLMAVKAPRASLSFTTPTRPTVITPVTGLEATDGTPDSGERTYRYLVMSMRLRG
jgi:DNA polymerase-3 subunit beta